METDLNKLRDRAYKNACEHGFHDEEKSDEHWLMLVITEISEAVNADRKNKHAKTEGFGEIVDYENISKKIDVSIFDYFFESRIKDTVEDEISDIVIRLLDFAGVRNIDLSKISGKLNERHYMLCLNSSEDRYFPKMMYDITKCICMEENIKDKIDCSIGFVFSVAYYYHIDLFQHIEWKMRYNELRPYKNGKKY